MIYRREIDGLRAVAILPVVLYHAGFSLFGGGYIGVDVFFVVSGYLITGILLSDLADGKFSIARFYERRARRILPALFFVLLCCIPPAITYMLPSQLVQLSKSTISVVLFVSNIFFWREQNYFAAGAEVQPLIHTWSLSVEEQYYILYPIFLLLLWRHRRDRTFHVIVITALASLVLSEWGWRNQPAANFYLAPTRAWELLLGAICAFVSRDRAIPPSNMLGLLGLALIAGAVFGFDSTTPFPSIYALAPTIGTALVLVFGTRGTIAASLLGTPLAVGIGLISYSTYLWHQPLFAFARIRSLSPPESGQLIGIAALSFVLGGLTWRYVEQPFRTTRSSFRRPPARTLLLGVSVAGVLAVAGVAGVLSRGLESRFPLSRLQRNYLQTIQSSPMRDRCHTGGVEYLSPYDSCVYFEGKNSVAVFGDSHAVELAYALAASLQPYGISIRHLSFSNCEPEYELEEFPDACAEWTQRSLEMLERSSEIKTIVISYFINPKFNSDRSEYYKKSLQSIIARLSKSKRVIYISQSPALPVAIDSLIIRNTIDDDGNVRGYDRATWNRMESPFEDWWGLSKIDKQAEIFNTTEYFCDKEQCFAGRGGRSYYFDDNHLSLYGAWLFAPDLARQIMQLEPGRR